MASRDNAVITPVCYDELARKLFPELTSFFNTWASRGWAERPKIKALRSIRIDRLKESFKGKKMPDDIIDAMLITGDDALTLKSELEAFSSPNGLLEMWSRYVGAVNRILDVYGKGEQSRYPETDSISYNPTSGFYVRFIDQIRAWYLSGDSGKDIPPLDAFYFAIRLLFANNRDDALRYPDLWAKDNAPASALARGLKWNDYPYTAILVPGEGPELTGVQLSPVGALKLEMAVKQFLEGKAPFLLVSGGTVHPAHTEFNEAQEMKSWLIGQHKIPPERIILEPYARHTTTNFRNAARALKMLGAPEKKPVLTVTDELQLEYIQSDRFRRNEKEELIHGVGKIGPKCSEFSIEFLPSQLCDVVDPMDPMDP